MPQFQTIHRPTVAGRIALRFIFVSAGIYVAAGLLAFLLTKLVPFRPVPGQVVFPPAFWWSTGLLALGSGCLQHAVNCVRRERQRPFRRSLLCALATGTLFVGIQSYGLACLARNQVPEDAQTGANAFITMLAALHAMHFALAQMFLVWVTLSALGDRYDHEYSWGVAVCAWFWHGLGIVWVLILVIFTIATELKADMGHRSLPRIHSVTCRGNRISNTNVEGATDETRIREMTNDETRMSKEIRNQKSENEALSSLVIRPSLDI